MNEAPLRNQVRNVVPTRMLVWGIYLGAILLALVFAWSPLSERLQNLLVLLPAANAVLVLVSSYRVTGRMLFAVAVIVALSFLSSALGANFGFPFGDIAYTQRLGPKLLDVPVGIPFLWLSVVLPAWIVAGNVLKYRHVVVASVVVTAFDSVLEFTADSLDLWHWLGGAPTELNYLSWFGIAWCSFTVLRTFAMERQTVSLAPHLLGAQIVFLVLVDLGIRNLAPIP